MDRCKLFKWEVVLGTRNQNDINKKTVMMLKQAYEKIVGFSYDRDDRFRIVTHNLYD